MAENKEFTAKEVYYNWRVYHHFLINNNLPDDSKTITVKELQNFVKNHIAPDEYDNLLKFCLEAY